MNSLDFARIVHRHREGLLKRALLLTGHHDAAWDLVQDTWERALRYYPAQLPEERVWSWLTTVMRNRFTDQVRRLDHRRNVRLSDEQWGLLSGPDLDEEKVSARFGEDDVRTGLDDLPEAIRVPYELHALQGLRYDEVAERLGVRMGTVGTRILRARRMLRGRLLEGPRKTAPAARKPRTASRGVARGNERGLARSLVAGQ